MINQGLIDKDSQLEPEITNARVDGQEPGSNDQDDYPFYIVPAPPVPGRTAWSVVPW